MADNFAMPNQQVPLGARPAEYGYGKGDAEVESVVKAGGKLVDSIGSGYAKRRDRKEQMDEAAANARGDAQTEWNKFAAKEAMKVARKVTLANNNTDNLVRLAETERFTSAKTGPKSASGEMAPQPSAAKPRKKTSALNNTQFPEPVNAPKTPKSGPRRGAALGKSGEIYKGQSTGTPSAPRKPRSTFVSRKP
jgi:hypothetical protein